MKRRERERRERTDDPRHAGGQMFDAGGPHDRGSVMFDARRAVIVEEIETAVAHTTRRGEPAEDVVALLVAGRINRPPDDEIAASAPHEPVRHLHMLSWDAVADLICDLQALAARDGFELAPLLERKWGSLKSRGLTTLAGGETGGRDG